MVRTPERSRRSSDRRRSAAVALAVAAGPVVLAAVLAWAPTALAALSSAGQAPPPATPPVEQIIITGTTPRFAVPDCVPRRSDEASQDACRKIGQVLRNDLRFEGVFDFVPDSLLSASPPQNPDAPNFEDWKGIGAKILVITRAEAAAGGELTVEARVYFVDSGQTMLARRYSGRSDNPRIFAHRVSDDIMTLTQLTGVARTRIAFVSDRDATAERRSKEVYIVDYDGYNPRRLTVNGSLNILPAWTPDGGGLVYVSWRQGPPLIYLARIFEGRSTANLTGERGDASAMAPSVSPDGQRIAFASTRAGSSDIWVSGMDGGGARRLTTTRASDTAPCWSPTGTEIGFTSDRAGTPQIYLMDAEGLNVRRLTTVGSWNDGCAWNPSKQYSEIAYTARLEAGGFDIAVLDLATRQVRQITQGRGSCEYPSWAPNGRHLAFSCKRGSRWEVTISDREGRSLTTLATGPGNNVQPDWGPSTP
jgi:TolB protein